MEKENKPTEQQPIEIFNEIKLNGISLTSSQESIDNLCGYMISLLKTKEVKTYLEIIRLKEKINGSTYYD